MEEFVNLLQEFVFNLMVLALPVLAVFLIALLKAQVKKALAEVEKAKPHVYKNLWFYAEMAVQAAEQMELAGFVSDKKLYALDIVQKRLNANGFEEFDIEVLVAAIEAEVLKQFPK